MVDAMGWFNLILILIMASIYPVKRAAMANSKGVGGKNSGVSLALYKKMRLLHPLLGGLIIVLGMIHGYLALGTVKLHTGLLVVITVMLMGALAIFGPKMKGLRKKWRNLHRGMGFILLIFVILHLFWRNLI